MHDSGVAENPGSGGGRAGRWRVVGWTAAVIVFLLPLAAMQITGQVDWSGFDFVVFGTLILGLGVALELAVRRTPNRSYRIAVGIAAVAAVLLVWINGAVGIIGSENNDANMLYAGVLAIGFLGALMARFRARGMAYALAAMAIAQGLIAVTATLAGWGRPWSGPAEILLLNGFFVGAWLIAVAKFRQAARERAAR